jgi:hypothetical protein
MNALAYHPKEGARRLLRLTEPLNSQDACTQGDVDLFRL